MAVEDVDMEKVIAFVNIKWSLLWESLPAIARIDADVMKQQWLATVYETVLADFVLSLKEKRFVPRISPRELEKEEDQSKAAALVIGIKDKHIPMIESRCQEDFDSVCSKIPAFVLATCFAAIEKNWLKENYFKIVEMVIQEAVDAAAFEFRSEVIQRTWTQKKKKQTLALSSEMYGLNTKQ